MESELGPDLRQHAGKSTGRKRTETANAEATMFEIVKGKVTDWPEGRRYVELNEAAADLRRAAEFLDHCADELPSGLPQQYEYALWIAAITLYGKVFRENRDRGMLTRGNIWRLLRARLTDTQRRTHVYVMILRDRYTCHDDGIGVTKRLGVGWVRQSDGTLIDVGVLARPTRTVSLGIDIARQLQPHFRLMLALVDEFTADERQRLMRLLKATDVNQLELTDEGPSPSPPIHIDHPAISAMIDEILARDVT